MSKEHVAPIHIPERATRPSCDIVFGKPREIVATNPNIPTKRNKMYMKNIFIIIFMVEVSDDPNHHTFE